MTVTVSEKGQLVIPKHIREKMKLKKGDSVVMALDEGRLLVEKSSKTKKRLKEDFDGLLKASESTLEFWNNETDEVWNNV